MNLPTLTSHHLKQWQNDSTVQAEYCTGEHLGSGRALQPRSRSLF